MATATAVESKEVNRYRWVILILMFSCFLFTFITRFSWPPLIPVVVPVLGMKMTQAGAFMSAFYFGYIITQIPAGVLADRFGVRTILALSLIIEGISTFAMGYMITFDMGFWLRFITGLGAGAVYAACARALMEWFPARERGTAFGIMLAAPSGGIVLSNYIVPALNKSVGWQGAFQAIGLATAAVGILIFILVRTSNEIKSSESMFGGFRVVFGSKDLIFTALAGFCLMWVELGTATWANAYIKKLGYTVQAAGLVMIFYGIGGVLAPLVSGYISDRIGQRKNILILSYALIIPLTIAFGYQTSITMLSTLGFIFGFCSYLANPHLTVLISEFAGKEWAATANGTANFIFQLAPMIGPVVLGWSIDFTGSFESVWWLMAAGPLLGILLLLPVRPENKRA
ncbi:major facilitator superfamily MFS_1 [Desulfofundulus kuznetsovii DSM 6115]|jgi:sugar phosphate permease|uniref:Major facilitator superfamily MFS_1 n=1 Tax=Desulfofundulus kuznetsovii (strain DSM 6115 / VKM B-1805 / 17) TaxID=760568 RepID=A0AAU8PJS3_DESK7|nr:major facilitator superfamily MFS_1 [Desulfofundulus kuznetsovii DSM 6115]